MTGRKRDARKKCGESHDFKEGPGSNSSGLFSCEEDEYFLSPGVKTCGEFLIDTTKWQE